MSGFDFGEFTRCLVWDPVPELLQTFQLSMEWPKHILELAFSKMDPVNAPDDQRGAVHSSVRENRLRPHVRPATRLRHRDQRCPVLRSSSRAVFMFRHRLDFDDFGAVWERFKGVAAAGCKQMQAPNDSSPTPHTTSPLPPNTPHNRQTTRFICSTFAPHARGERLRRALLAPLGLEFYAEQS